MKRQTSRSVIVPLYLALATVVLGQVGRIPPLQGGGTPFVLDGLLVVLLTAWLMWVIWKRVALPWTAAHMAWAAFLIICLLTLLASPLHLGKSEMLTALLYTVRLSIYTSLFWIIPTTITSDADLAPLMKTFLWTGIGVVVLGFIQLMIVPDISFLGHYGWDPHIGRFVSTFLDPNYLGGYLALILSFTFATITVRKRVSWWYWAFAALTVVAGVLTFSRSGYLAIALVLVLVGLRYSWKLLLLAVICIVPLTLTIPRVSQRILGGFSIDSTAQDRIQSWGVAETMINTYPIFGVGYNAYAPAQEQLGTVSVLSTSNANGGSDSSVLNIMATTGFVGFVIAAIFGFRIMFDALTRITASHGEHVRIVAYTLLFGLPALLLNAMFVNALFYPLILVPLAALIGALYVGAPQSSGER